MAEEIVHTRFQFRLRTLFIVTVLVAIPLVGFVLWKRSVDRFFHDVFVGETGPVSDRQDWPEPLAELAAEFAEWQLDEGSVQVFCLCRGWDQEYVWRMAGDASVFDELKKKWRLTPVQQPDWRVLEGRSDVSGVEAPPWWSPRRDGQTEFFVCPQELAKEKGPRFQVAFDAGREAIFVRYWFNF